MKKAILFLFLGVCSAQSPQVPVTGSLGPGGSFPLINSPAVVFAADANHVMSYPETSGGVLIVTSTTSLTTTRQLVAPLLKGFQWVIKNATSGGQAIQVIGVSGAGVTIPNGSAALVFCDGANYLNDAGAIPYPASGVANSTGTGWGTSYQVGTGANNLVQLNASAALPAVSAANLTNLNGANLQSSSVANSALANDSMTINSTSCLLGSSCTIAGGSGYSLGGTITSANVVLGPGAGTGATLAVGGVDGAHIITITTGTGCTPNAVVYTVTFTAPRSGTVAVLNPAGGGWGSFSSLAQIPFINSVVATGYQVVSGTAALADSTGYTFYVSVP